MQSFDELVQRDDAAADDTDGRHVSKADHIEIDWVLIELISIRDIIVRENHEARGS
jgi:hypothetical protein